MEINTANEGFTESDLTPHQIDGIIVPRRFSQDYFFGEITRLRDMWGMKEFWKDIEKAREVLSRVLYVYQNTEGLDDMDARIMNATCTEFNQRLFYLLVGA